jgi:hypothetical protein
MTMKQVELMTERCIIPVRVIELDNIRSKVLIMFLFICIIIQLFYRQVCFISKGLVIVFS